MPSIIENNDIIAILNVIDPDTGQHVDPASFDDIVLYKNGVYQALNHTLHPADPAKVDVGRTGKTGTYRIVFTGITSAEGDDWQVGVALTIGATAYSEFMIPVTIVGGTTDIDAELAKVPKRGDGDTYKQLRDSSGTLLQQVRETLTETEQGS